MSLTVEARDPIKISQGSSSCWQRSLRESWISSTSLLAKLELQELSASLSQTEKDFRLQVSPEFVSKMQVGDPRDPLFLQVWPSAEEDQNQDQFNTDPVGEQSLLHDGVIQKYASRALVISTAACALHCRYCFRRAFPYQSDKFEMIRRELVSQLEKKQWKEVIFSGGDPLVLRTEKLANLVEPAYDSEYVDTLRFHTRVLCTLPNRFTDRLLQQFNTWCEKKNVVVVFHINHAQEISRKEVEICRELQSMGVMLLNQSVLLKGINDNVDKLEELSWKLHESHIHPYYLHQLDRVKGASHFEVASEKGMSLIEELRTRVPGYLVPRYVQELAGEKSKTPLI